MDLTYDRNSNITLSQDYVLKGTSSGHLFDAAYTMDDLNRLTRAKEGHWGGSSITTTKRDELWPGLSQTGNWLERKLDLDGNGTFSGTGEMDDSGTFNTANEWKTRDLDSTPGTTTDNFSLVHDAVGNMTDDGKEYKYVYDAFGRLVTVKDTTSATVAEYRYNGLGYRISWHYDADADKDVDGSDPTYYFAYDDRWRVVATFRGSDTYAKENFTFHNAGANGHGGSSYIDLVVLRDTDVPDQAWTAVSDGVLSNRVFYCQNWRADVSVITDTDATPIEWIKYSAYGEASSFALADYDMDGDIDSADQTAWFAAVGGGNGNTDLDFDGDNATSADDDAFFASYGAASTGGRGALSRGKTANRIGYAGYQWDQSATAYHVRHRVYRPEIGQWTRRDPIKNITLYEFAARRPVVMIDPDGRLAQPAGPGGGGLITDFPILSDPLWMINPPPTTWTPFVPENPFTYPTIVINPNCGSVIPPGTENSPAFIAAVSMVKSNCSNVSMVPCTTVTINCPPGGECGGASASGCNIDINPPCENDTFQPAYLYHELRHVAQNCTMGDEPSCDESITREFDAYRYAGQCSERTIQGNIGSCCYRACESVMNDTNCFNTRDACVDRCKNIVAQGGVGGIGNYRPPSPIVRVGIIPPR